MFLLSTIAWNEGFALNIYFLMRRSCRQAVCFIVQKWSCLPYSYTRHWFCIGNIQYYVKGRLCSTGFNSEIMCTYKSLQFPNGFVYWNTFNTTISLIMYHLIEQSSYYSEKIVSAFIPPVPACLILTYNFYWSQPVCKNACAFVMLT